MDPKTQDQTVQSEEYVVPAGEETEVTGTAPVEGGTGIVDKTPTGTSIEDILGVEETAPVKSDIQKSKEGTPPWHQARIDEITKKYREAEQRVKDLEAERLVPKEVPLAPVLDEYGSTQEWQEAMVKWQGDVLKYNTAIQKAEESKVSENARIAANNERFLKQVEDLKKKFPDAEEVIAGTFYGAAQDIISDSDESARIALYLNKNPKELERIKSLGSSVAISREIGKLEQKFTSARSKMTSAPKPISPVDANSGAVNVNENDLSDDAWFKRYQNERLKKLKQKFG